MKHNIFLCVFLVLINGTALSKTDESLRLRLETFQNTFVLGEPVLIQIVFENIGQEEIKLWGGFINGSVQIFIISPDGSTHLHQTCVSKMTGLPASVRKDALTIPIAPGGETGFYLPIDKACKKWLFPDIGNYQIRAQCSLNIEHEIIWTGEISSDELTVTIIEPNEIDRMALSSFQEISQNIGVLDDYLFYLNDWERELNSFREFLARYPESTYAKYAHFWLTLAKHGYAPTPTYYKESSIKMAARHRKTLVTYPEFSYTNIVKFYLAECLFKMEQYEESLQLFQEAVAENRYPRAMVYYIPSYVAECYYRLGDKDTARTLFEQVLRNYGTATPPFWERIEEFGLESLDTWYMRRHSRKQRKEY